jgi:hypothetical protein
MAKRMILEAITAGAIVALVAMLALAHYSDHTLASAASVIVRELAIVAAS